MQIFVYISFNNQIQTTTILNKTTPEIYPYIGHIDQIVKLIYHYIFFKI